MPGSSEPKRLVLGTSGGAPLAISALIDMLLWVREQTVRAVEGLTVAQLDHRHDDASNSIGALLWHIVAVETWYQIESFEKRVWTSGDAARWDAALDLGVAARTLTGYPLEHYLDMLATARARTIQELRGKNEAWLLEEAPLEGAVANNYWKWFHVCEDEAGHAGQIRWLKKRLPSRKAPPLRDQKIS